MKLHHLRPAKGAKKERTRVGRGIAAGKGKTAGRGTKGQKARAGGSIPPWFEGGQTPLHVRTPKLHGFRNRGRVAYAAVNLSALTDAEAGTLITPDVLIHDGLVRRSKTKALPVKILGNGDAPTGVTIHAHAFSRSALDKLTAAGSTTQRISWPDGNPIDEEAEAKAIAEADAKNEAKAAARGTIRALGLRRLHHTVEVVDTPQARGMLRRVAFLVDVTELALQPNTEPATDTEAPA